MRQLERPNQNDDIRRGALVLRMRFDEIERQRHYRRGTLIFDRAYFIEW